MAEPKTGSPELRACALPFVARSDGRDRAVARGELLRADDELVTRYPEHFCEVRPEGPPPISQLIAKMGL